MIEKAIGSSVSAQNSRQRILRADAGSAIGHLNSEALLRSGYRMEVAANGAIAWDSLQIDTCDLLVTDYEMPVVTGVELKTLHAAKKKLPVIMTAGKVPTWKFVMYPVLQPAANSLKPCPYEELLRTVKNVLYANGGDRQEMAPPDCRRQPSVRSSPPQKNNRYEPR